MLKLLTELSIPPAHFLISHNEQIFSMGSCFADVMALKLKNAKFKVLDNPFGVLYNSIAIENALLRIYSRQYYTSDELFENDSVYHTWDHHSSKSGVDIKETLKDINASIDQAHEFLQKVDVVILTLGSSFYYVLKDLDLPVANCHKLPSSAFEKRLLTVQENMEALENCISMVKDISEKSPNFILNLSPVVHLKDSLIGNRRSKSIALESIHQVIEKHPEAYYFPSFEIVQDELRDYRFYHENMTHPTEQTKNYIWERFSENLFPENTRILVKEIESLEREKNHRSLFPNSKEDQKRLANLEKKLQTFRQAHPEIDL